MKMARNAKYRRGEMARRRKQSISLLMAKILPYQ